MVASESLRQADHPPQRVLVIFSGTSTLAPRSNSDTHIKLCEPATGSDSEVEVVAQGDSQPEPTAYRYYCTITQARELYHHMPVGSGSHRFLNW